MGPTRRNSLDNVLEEEQSPFLSQDETFERQRDSISSHRRSLDAREPRFSLQDMEYPDTSIPLDSHPLLDEALLSDPSQLQRELGLALGLDSGHPSWLPSENGDTRRTDEGDSTNDATVHFPETSRRARDSRIYPHRDSTQDRDLTYEIPMITLNTTDVPQQPHTRENALDLEAGLYVPPATPTLREFPVSPLSRPAPGSPSKLSGFITRISDRIAGTEHPQTPVTDKNTSSFWGKDTADQMSRRSSDVSASHISSTNDLGNASSTSIFIPSLPFMAPHERSHHSSMESIHSNDTQDDVRAPNTSSFNSRLTPISSFRPSPSTSDVSSNSSENTPSIQNSRDDMPPLHGNSLGVFSPASSFRNWCHKIVSSKFTNITVTIVIILQTLLLAHRQWNPVREHGYFFDGYSAGDYTLIVINCLYTAEIAMKIVSYGLYDDEIMFANLGMPYPEGHFVLNNSYFFSILRDKALALWSQIQRARITPLTKSPHRNPEASHVTPIDESTSSREFTVHGCTSNYSGVYFADSNRKFRDPGSVTSLSAFKPAERRLLAQNTFMQLRYFRNVVDDLQMKRAVLRDNWQRLDLIAVISFWISLPMSLYHWDASHHIMIFRAISCVRIFRLCKLTDGTNMILRACESCLPQLIDVGIFIACFWFIIGIVGVQSFKSSLTRHCVWTNPDDSTDTFINSDLYCGSYIGTDGTINPFIDRHGNHGDMAKGFRCPMYSVCQSGENPYGGTVNFDNILQSMQMVFVMISVNTFSDIMYNLTDSDNLAAALYFIVGIFILTVWLMNIFVAIIVSSFKSIQLEAAEEEKRNAGKLRRVDLIKSLFSNDVHSTKVRELIDKKPLLKFYYRFEFIFIVIILAAFVTQTSRSSEMSEEKAHMLYRAESAFTLILLLEIILRFMLYVPQIKTFFLSRRNCFDLGLAVITSIIVIGPVKEKLGHAYYWLTFFQCARFYRVVLFSSITSDLWIKIFKNFKPIYDLTLFYFILLFLSSIIVARFFEGTIPLEDVDSVQFAMHTLPNAAMSLYVITSTENWADIMYELQEYAENTFQRATGSILLIFWFMVTNLVVMNIFIAVIAASLEISIEGRKRYQVRHFIDDMTERLQTVRANPGWIHKLKSKAFKPKEEKNMEKAITNLLLSGRAVNEFLDSDNVAAQAPSSEVNVPKNGFMRWLTVKRLELRKHFRNPFYHRQLVETDVTDFNPAEFATRVITERRKLISDQDQYLKENPNFNTVFYVMGPRHKLRRFCQKIVPSSHGERIDGVEPNKTISEVFSFLMFCSTIGIVVTACYQTPLYRSEVNYKYGKWNWTFYIDTAFQGIFTIEFLVKVIADGLFFTPNAYVRSPWNWLDFGALTSLWIEFIAFLKDDSDLSRIVRGLKALRALRILTISETAKNNFHYTMISGFGKILSAAIISLTLILPFSVWGLNVFNGRLGYCLDGSSPYSECFNEFQNEVFDWTVVSPNVYVQPYLEMDSFTSSFSSFYQIVSLEGWVDLLINVMQSTGRGTPQKMFATPINGLFIIFFNFVSTVFILTLFVSVIISNYSRVTGRAYLTPIQVQWYHVKKFLLQVKPSKRERLDSLKGVRRKCYAITVEKNRAWTFVLNSVLILHIFMLLLEAFPTVVSSKIRYACFIVVSSCYLVHYIMLIIAQTFRVFAKNKWNIFSFFVAFGAWNTTILVLLINTDSVFSNFNKLFLVGLLVFLFPRSDRLNQLLKFASASFPSLFSLMFTWFVMFLMYAIAMNQIFGLTKIGPNTSGNINLRSVPKSLILLFRCSFGEGWNYIMDDFTLTEPFCLASSAGGDSDCGSLQYAYVLFMSWNVISMYIMLNLFVSLILDSFSYIAGGKEYAHLISRTEVRKYKRCWQKFDPKGTGFISPADLPQFLHLLDGSLSFHFYNGVLSIPQLCEKWITRKSQSDPYDIKIDLEEMNTILLMMNIPKIQERRRIYERFIEKALMNMELHEEPGISFSKLLVQIPLYNSFNVSECLIFIDFMEADLLERRVVERLQKRRCYELIEGYVCRWRYLRWRRGEMLKEEFLSRKAESPAASLYEAET